MSKRGKIRLDHQERCIGCYNCVFTCSLELFNVVSATRTAVSIKPCSPGEGFIVVFCAGCDEAPCVEACQSKALLQDLDRKLKLISPSECDKCETFDCVRACVIGALQIDPETNRPVLCTQCGKCVEVCPHEVIVYVEEKR